MKKWNLKLRRSEKVNFFVLGGQKCGTTSLHFYLNQHPMLTGSFPKEVDFFSYDGFYSKGVDWYHQNFDNKLRSKGLLKFDSSTEYLYLSYCAKRIYKYNSDAKFIVITRDPVERAISAYKMYKQLADGKLWSDAYLRKLKFHRPDMKNNMQKLLYENPFPDFNSMIEREFKTLQSRTDEDHYEPSLISRGNYDKQLESYYKYFPKKNIHVVDFEEYSNNTIEVLNDTLCFLGIKNDKFDESYDFSIKLKSSNFFDSSSIDYEYLNSLFQKVYKNSSL